MFHYDAGARAHKAFGVRTAVVAVQIAVATAAFAQGSTSAPAEAAPSEAARRAAQAPYRLILMLSDTPSRKKAPEPVERKPKAKPEAAPALAEPAAPAPQSAVARTSPPPAVVQPTASAPTTAAEPPAQLAKVEAKPRRGPRVEIVPLQTEMPQLTTALVREHAEGTVKVGFWVQPDGSTGGLKVVSTTNRKLNNISTNAVSGWKFEPIDEPREVEVELVYRDGEQ